MFLQKEKMGLIETLFGKKSNSVGRGYISSYDRQQVSERWAKIDELVTVGKPSALKEAVIEADKIVDFCLDKLYPNQETMGERLKLAKEVFKNYRREYENLWYAHKLRNELVHKMGFELPVFEAKNLLDFYKSTLEIAGAM